MFCDVTNLLVIAGRGGNGCISFRREKYIDRGGPNGGNGGNGGNVIFKVNPHLNSLLNLHIHKVFQAEAGEHGLGWQKHGANAPNLILEVPLGTIIKDKNTDEIIVDLVKEGEFVIAKGGRGGYGNEHFKSSTRQAPHFAELGEPGEQKELTLELKLVADVGIIGLPNAGKSTLISVITSARPKIADYQFTTLIPNLGVAKVRDDSLIIADIPGIIEGASKGKGLGDEFLRHISRNSILVHLIDVQSANIVQDYKLVQNELKLYSEDLANKKQIIVFNKIDSEDIELNQMIATDFRKKAKISAKTPIFFISALMQIGLLPLLDHMKKLVDEEHAQLLAITAKNEINNEMIVYKPLPEEDRRYFAIKELVFKNNNEDNIIDDENSYPSRIFQIHGQRINQIAIMTDFNNAESVDRLWDVFKKLGIWQELENRQITEKDKIGFARFDYLTDYRERLSAQ